MHKTHNMKIGSLHANHQNICVVAWYVEGTVAKLFLEDALDIIHFLSDDILVITNDEFRSKYMNVTKIGINQMTFLNSNVLFRMLRFVTVHLLIILNLIKYSNRYQILFSVLGGTSGEGHLFPILIANILNKKSIAIHRGGNKSYDMKLIEKSHFGKIFFPPIIEVFQLISYRYTTTLIIQSDSIVRLYNLGKYSQKIAISSGRYINTDIFSIIHPLETRDIIIGYIGRFSEEKGILNFIDAIPLINEENHKFHFLIIGEGHLFPIIERKIEQFREKNINCELKSWVSHDTQIPQILNKILILVVPSYTEGLPGIVLEAMACGTPVLATPIGAIPDVIRDGETGFIMEDNSPECIARNVMRALSDPDLEGVAERGRRLVVGKFTFEKTVERWRRIFERL